MTEHLTSASFPAGIASNRTEAQVRAALNFAKAEDAYRMAYHESIKDGVSLEARALLILAMDDATDAMSAARKALTAAKVAA